MTARFLQHADLLQGACTMCGAGAGPSLSCMRVATGVACQQHIPHLDQVHAAAWGLGRQQECSRTRSITSPAGIDRGCAV